MIRCQATNIIYLDEAFAVAIVDRSMMFVALKNTKIMFEN